MFSLQDMWQQMGPMAKAVAVILLGMGVFVIGVSLERLYSFLKARKESVAFLLQLRVRLKDGKLGEATNDAQAFKRSPLAHVIGAGVAEWTLAEPGRGDGQMESIDAVNRAIERTKERETADLRRGLSFLATVASSAPFVGLFGTVIGIINAFQKMAGDGRRAAARCPPASPRRSSPPPSASWSPSRPSGCSTTSPPGSRPSSST